MKKFLKVISVITLITFSLCGCSLNIVPVSHTNEYIVTALGFDCKDENIKVTLETLIVGTEQSSEETNAKTFSSEGKEIPVAIEKIGEKATQSLEMSHCAVAVIGETVTAHYMEKICEYFNKSQELTLSAFFISTESAEKLLSQKAVSSVAVGFDIVSMLEKQSRQNGIKFKNRFFEVESARKKAAGVFSLPFISGEGEGLSYEGAVIYSNHQNYLKLNGEQLFFYALANDLQGKGKVNLGGDEININSAYTSFKTKETGGKMKITANITIDTEQNKIPINESIENGIKDLFNLSKQTKIDVLGIGNLLYQREKQFFEKNGNFYENTEYSVKINEE